MRHLNSRGNLLLTLMNFPTVITFFLGLRNAMVIVIQLIPYNFSYVVSTQISGVKMGRPKKSDHPRHKYPGKNSFGGRGTVLTKGSIQRKRPSQALCQLASTNLGVKSTASLPGIRLRPNDKPEEVLSDNLSSNCNDVIDIQKQQASYEHAHRQHKHFSTQRRSTKHVPTLIMKKCANRGFGVTVQFVCKRCTFQSERYNLFESTETGACLTNIQTGVAFSKTCVKPADAEFLFTTLNLSCPTRKTMQKHFNYASQTCEPVCDESLAENRGFLRDYGEITSPTPSESTKAPPKPTVSADGQYNRPVYHGFDGKATSVSEPVVEEETGLHMLVGHAVISKKDGSYPVNKVSLSGFSTCVVLWSPVINP